MKKSMLFILLIIVVSSNILFAQKKKKKSKSEKAANQYKNIVVSITNNYLPYMYQRVINENYCGPDCYRSFVGKGKDKKYIPWNMKVNKKIVYDEIGTILHESVHGFNKGPSRHTRGSEFLKFTHRILVSPYEFIDYEGKDVIKSYKIVDDILENNPKIADLFRFDLYIGDNSNTSSNISGIYGLLEEFSAYYHGCNTSFILYNHVKDNGEFDGYLLPEQSIWGGDSIGIDGSIVYDDSTLKKRQFLLSSLANDCMSHYGSYYEFNIFIGAYLKYVKTNYPKMYYDILNNDQFRHAYKMLDDNFSKLVIRMEKEFGNGFKPYKDSGITYRSGVKNRDLGKEIIVDYKDILNEFKNFEGAVSKNTIIE